MTAPVPPAAPSTDPVIGGQPAPTPQPVVTPPQPVAAKPADDTSAKLAAIEEQLKSTGKERDDLKGILEKLGAVLNPGQGADPEVLQKNLQQRDEELTESRRELAVLRIAGGELGGTLLDSRKFMSSVKGLDPTGNAFEEKVKAAVAERTPAADDSTPPKSKTGPAPKKSAGADLNGGSTGSKKQLTRADLANMNSEQIVKAQSEGLLDDLLAGKA